MAKYSTVYIKNRTNELYDSLPMDKDERMKQLSVRDEIIDLNYSFFGYVASTTFVENTTYEDKLQTGLMAFLGMWWKYKWSPKYRSDVSFAVFFKPRISEEIRRYLSIVSYTTQRGLRIKAAEQLKAEHGIEKPWTEIDSNDLSKITLRHKDMIALKAVLSANYAMDMSSAELFIGAKEETRGIDFYQTDKYDSIEELLIQEMIEQESQLSDSYLKEMSELYTIDYDELLAARPKAMETLYRRLTDNL